MILRFRGAPCALAACLLVLGACASPPPADVGALVPATAEAALLLPPLGTLREPLIRLANAIEGAEGAVDWLDRRFGIDLGSPYGIEATGLDPAAGLAVFALDGRVFVVAGVRDPQVLTGHLVSRLQLFGYGLPVAAAGEPAVATVEGRGSTDGVPSLAYGIDGRVFVLAFRASAEPPAAGAAPEAAPVDAVRALLTGTSAPRLDAEPRFRALAGDGGPERVRAWLDLRKTLLTEAAVDALLAPLGFARPLVKPAIAGFDRLGVELAFDSRRLAVHLRAGRAPDAPPFPVEWFEVAGDGAAFGALLPGSTSLLLRLRVNTPKLRELPSFLLGPLLGRAALGKLHPAAAAFDIGRDLLPFLTGNIGIAVLGLSDGASLPSLARAAGGGAAIAGEVNAAVMLELRDPVGFETMVGQRLATLALPPPGLQSISAGEGPVRAFHVPGGSLRHLGVALSGNVLVLASGRGELERIVRAGAGLAPSLRDRARTDLDREVVGATTAALALHASFDRVARQLQCKGFPPYFLRVVTSPDAIAFALRLAAGEAVLDVEVSL